MEITATASYRAMQVLCQVLFEEIFLESARGGAGRCMKGWNLSIYREFDRREKNIRIFFKVS